MFDSKKLVIALGIAVMLLALVTDNKVSASPVPAPEPAPAPAPCGGCEEKPEKDKCGKKKDEDDFFKKLWKGMC